MKMCQGAAIARKTMVLEMGASCLMRVKTAWRLRRVSARWARTMRMGKTTPISPLVRTLRAQQAAKAQQRSGFGVDSVEGEGVRGEPVAVDGEGEPEADDGVGDEDAGEDEDAEAGEKEDAGVEADSDAGFRSLSA
jgi:hypothetical protein